MFSPKKKRREKKRMPCPCTCPHIRSGSRSHSRKRDGRPRDLLLWRHTKKSLVSTMGIREIQAPAAISAVRTFLFEHVLFNSRRKEQVAGALEAGDGMAEAHATNQTSRVQLFSFLFPHFPSSSRHHFSSCLCLGRPMEVHRIALVCWPPEHQPARRTFFLICYCYFFFLFPFSFL